ncbi:competence protein ComK [Halalkalibacter nanhaiisediminis]|uniref:Competence protein ComK n=1 Tax=Halalkalibacter nanhaiisediminis TaxID=688079 RepID=A0A562QT80_9BACI|nr:competence protein ComK [Halalkalibacter nanhaiisediminis]TWI59897.1 competence protein ComK [Halalkalibacter nanhaiisediminis]
MTKTILHTYEINKDTISLSPANHMDYDTIVQERNQKYYVKKTPIQLIEQACLEGGATYDGRRVAVTYQTGAQSKVPIPIHPLEQIFAFPTHSPKLQECSWIFYHHIKAIKPNPKAPNQTIITFRNYKEITVDVSYNALERQIHRTAYCIVRFTNRYDEPPMFG